MSISSELSRLQAAKADIAAALAEKGVSVPAGSTLDTFGNLVRQVKTGSTVLSATFSASQWTGSADPYTLTISAADRDGTAPLLYQVECLSGGTYRRDASGGTYRRDVWAAFNTAAAYDQASAALILTSRHKFAGKVTFL